MIALVARIRAFASRHKGVDGRDKHGHDGAVRLQLGGAKLFALRQALEQLDDKGRANLQHGPA